MLRCYNERCSHFDMRQKNQCCKHDSPLYCHTYNEMIKHTGLIELQAKLDEAYIFINTIWNCSGEDLIIKECKSFMANIEKGNDDAR